MSADRPIAAPGAAVGRSGRVALRLRRTGAAALPILCVVAVIFAIWYLAVAPMNIHGALDMADRDGIVVVPETPAERRAAGAVGLVLKNPAVVPRTYALDRPQLPAPHQVAAELWNTVATQPVTSRRSLVYHAWITLSATLLGFGIGTALGVLLAVGIVQNRAMDLSVMPWAIASQTIPILAIAPMIIVVLNSVGVTGLAPKAMISAYLSFFPVVVGMVTGLRSPGAAQLDLLRTYSASRPQTFWKLRLPASLPYLFASLKIGVAASLVGAIVGELPTGAQAGLGARLLAGSYYGQTAQIWAALFGAAILAALLVGAIGAVQRVLLRRMGMAP